MLRDALERQEVIGDRAAMARVIATLAETMLSSGRARDGLEMLEQATLGFAILAEENRGLDAPPRPAGPGVRVRGPLAGGGRDR